MAITTISTAIAPNGHIATTMRRGSKLETLWYVFMLSLFYSTNDFYIQIDYTHDDDDHSTQRPQ